MYVQNMLNMQLKTQIKLFPNNETKYSVVTLTSAYYSSKYNL